MKAGGGGNERYRHEMAFQAFLQAKRRLDAASGRFMGLIIGVLWLEKHEYERTYAEATLES